LLCKRLENPVAGALVVSENHAVSLAVFLFRGTVGCFSAKKQQIVQKFNKSLWNWFNICSGQP